MKEATHWETQEKEDISQHTTQEVKTSCRDALRADSDASGRIQSMPSEGRQSWHYDTPTSLRIHPPGPQDSSRDYGPEEAAGSRRRAVGTAEPFQGLRADQEQWTPLSTPQGQQYLPRNYGPDGSAGWLCRSAPRQADDSTTRPSGRRPTRQSDALDLGPSFYRPIDRQGSGRVTNDHKR